MPRIAGVDLPKSKKIPVAMTYILGIGRTSAQHILQQAGVDVMLDDRGERPGVMFADWELIGVPHRVVIGERGLKEGQLEYQGRRDTAATPIPRADMTDFLKAKLA